MNIKVQDGMISVIQDLSKHYNNNTVSKLLGLSPNTVKNYLDPSLISKSREGLIRLNKPMYRLFRAEQADEDIDYDDSLVQAKFDGMRIEINKRGEDVEFFSEDELIEKTDKLSIQAKELNEITNEDVTLDAEALWFHDKTTPGFRTDITGYLNSKETDMDNKVVLFVFDIMRYGKEDLTKLPLRLRLEFLDKLKSKDHIKILNRDKLMGFIVKKPELEESIGKVSKLPASEGAMIKDMNSEYRKTNIQNPGWTKFKKQSEVDVIVLDKDQVEGTKDTFNFHIGVGPISESDAKKLGPKKTWLFRDKWYMYLGKTFNSKEPAKIGDIIRVAGQILRIEADGVFSYSIFTPKVLESVPEKDRSDTINVLENLFRAQKLPPKRDPQRDAKLKKVLKAEASPDIFKAKDITDEEFEKYSKEGGPLPDKFYEAPLHTNGWVQFHIRGIPTEDKDKFEKGELSLDKIIRENSVHADIRIVGPDKRLIQWVLPGDPKDDLAKLRRAIEGKIDPDTGQVQKIQAIVKPSAEAARDEPTEKPVAKQSGMAMFDLNLKMACNKAESIPNHILMQSKEYGIKQGSFWIPPGEVGANPDTWSYLLLVDRLNVDGGVQRRDMHEYWIRGKHFNGRYVFRAQKGGQERTKPGTEGKEKISVFWQMIKPEDNKPLNPKEHDDQGELFPIFESKVRRAEKVEKAVDPNLESALEKIASGQLAKTNQMTAKGNDILKLDDVFNSLPKDPICLKSGFIMMTGGIVNRGETDGDIDMLIRCNKENDEFNIPSMFRTLRGIDNEAMRKQFADRAEWCYKDARIKPDGTSERLSDYGGPFTKFMPAYDLYLIPRNEKSPINMSVQSQGKLQFKFFGGMGIIRKAAGATAEKGDIFVAGLASNNRIDREGEQVDMGALKRAFNIFFADRDFANLNVLHSTLPVGQLIDKLEISYGVLTNYFDNQGLHIVGKLREGKTETLRQTRQEVLDGKLNSFSIGGWANDKRMVCNISGKCAKKIMNLELWEITLCYEGQNQDAKFQVFA